MPVKKKSISILMPRIKAKKSSPYVMSIKLICWDWKELRHSGVCNIYSHIRGDLFSPSRRVYCHFGDEWVW